MSTANRRAEFFALEASEYLAELEPLAARADTPDIERLVRGARALRGAALMAGLGTFARAAAGLESVARQVRDHALGWDPQARAGWREGLATLRGLVNRATGWEAADDRQALALADRLERIAAGHVAEPQATAQPPVAALGPAPGGLSPGVRAFIARESQLIAGSLLEASRALAPLPPAAALAGVLERMRSLRGVGGAGELTPLPELLEAMEATTRSLLHDAAPPPDVAGVFADAADALGAMARSVAEEGRVLVPPGLDQVARRLLDAFTAERDVVPIESLARSDEPVMLERGTPPDAAAGGDPIPIELVGVGDHLAMQADALDRVASPAARDLQLFVLHRTLATMPAKGGTGRFLAPLARAITRAIGAGEAARTPDQFSERLRTVGRFLTEAADSRDAAGLLVRRADLVRELGDDVPSPSGHPADSIDDVPADIASRSEAPVVPAAAALAADVVPIHSLAPDADVVPIEALAPDEGLDVVPIEALAPEDDLDVVPIEALAPDDDVVPIAMLAPDDDRAAEPGDRLVRAFRRREALARAPHQAQPSLDGLGGEGVVVPMDDLLYRGERALARAEELRAQLAGVLSEPTVSLDRLRPLLDELLDLVPLARDAA